MNLILIFESDFIDTSRKRVLIKRLSQRTYFKYMPCFKRRNLKAGHFGGMMGTAKIENVSENGIEMELDLSQPPPPPLHLTLILALPRPKTLKKVIESATSAGIKRIYLIESWRVEKSFWSSPVLKPENMNHLIHLGLQQSRDTIAPVIEFRQRFKPFVEDEIPALIEGTRPLLAHPYASTPCPCNLNIPVTLAVGPEGGFIPYEVELLQKQGFEAVTLGRRTLRVEYAIPTLVGRIMNLRMKDKKYEARSTKYEIRNMKSTKYKCEIMKMGKIEAGHNQN